MKDILAIIGAVHIAVSAVSISTAFYSGYSGGKMGCQNYIAYSFGYGLASRKDGRDE